MSALLIAGVIVVTLVALAGALLALAEIVAWPEPGGRVIAGYLPRRGRQRMPEYSSQDLVVRTRGMVVADLVVRGEVIISGRPIDEASEIFQELTGEPWSRARIERTETREVA